MRIWDFGRSAFGIYAAAAKPGWLRPIAVADQIGGQK